MIELPVGRVFGRGYRMVLFPEESVMKCFVTLLSSSVNGYPFCYFQGVCHETLHHVAFHCPAGRAGDWAACFCWNRLLGRNRDFLEYDVGLVHRQRRHDA